MIQPILTAKIETWVGIAVIGFVAISLGALVFSKINDFNNYVDMLNTEYSQEGVLIISLREAKRINKWIKANNLNQYGDPLGTVYSGGTPLFDETTGETMGRFEYIAKKYPGRPWK